MQAKATGGSGGRSAGRLVWRAADPCFLACQQAPGRGTAEDAERPGERYRGSRFDLLVCGLPFDFGASHRTGADKGPGAVRAASLVLEEYSLSTGGDLRLVAAADGGDLVAACEEETEDDRAGAPPSFRPGAARRAICGRCEELLGPGGLFVGIGGDHSVSAVAAGAVGEWLQGRSERGHAAGTIGSVRASPLSVLVLDAHADLRDSYGGSKWSHACAAARLLDVVGPGRLQQAGVRSAERTELEAAELLGLSWAGGRGAGRKLPVSRRPWRAARVPEYGSGLEAAALHALKLLPDSGPLYLSVDLDVVDPAFAPGVGAPEPGGPSAAELLAAVSSVARRAGPRLVGLDVVEVNLEADPAGVAAVLAAKVIREVVLARGVPAIE